MQTIQYTYSIISRWVRLRMKNVSDKISRETRNTLLMSSNFFFWKQRHLLVNAEKYSRAGHRPQMTIWRMRIACWTRKATNTHSEYVMLMALPLQQWLHERVSVLRFTCIACVVTWQCVWVAASSTHLTSFNTRFLIPSTIMSRPTMSKPASVARTSVSCSGSSTGMWYFFIPAKSSRHYNSSELRKPLLIQGSGLWSTQSCLRPSFSNNWSYFTKFGAHVITVEVTPTTVQ
jgi:hypothetical protein